MDVGRDRVPMLTAVTKDVVLTSSWRKSHNYSDCFTKAFPQCDSIEKNGFVLPATVLNQLLFAYDSYDIIFSIKLYKFFVFNSFLVP